MNKKNIMMIYHIPLSKNDDYDTNNKTMSHYLNVFQNDDFYQVFVLPYFPGKNEREDIKIEILDLKNAKKATMSVINDIKDTTEYYFNYEKWLRNQKLKRLSKEEKN